jgi:hypothetical protein
MNKNRWLYYIFFGILFGIFDFYYQRPVQSIKNNLLLIFVILVVWLFLAVPVAINEVKVTGSPWKAALASMVSWMVAVISYYLYMTFKLVFIGEPSRPEMHISNRADPYFWDNIKNHLLGDVLGGVGEWILVAIIGGIVVGHLTAKIYLKFKPSELKLE